MPQHRLLLSAQRGQLGLEADQAGPRLVCLVLDLSKLCPQLSDAGLDPGIRAPLKADGLQRSLLCAQLCLGLVAPVGQDLVGRDGDRPDLLDLTAIFTDVVFPQRGLVEQLAPPLPHGDGVGRKDQRAGPHHGHHLHPDDRLASAARQHNHAAATARAASGVEATRGLLLVGPQRERLAIAGATARGELQLQGLASHIAGEVIDRETRKIIARLEDEEGRPVQSEKMLEIDFRGNQPMKAGDQFGFGRPAVEEE